MIKVVDSNFMVCADCIQVIANGDYSSLDCHYDFTESEQRKKEIKDGLSATDGEVVVGEPESDKEFTSMACDCCASHLAGTRHHCIVIDV